jgi:hypothetical protein
MGQMEQEEQPKDRQGANEAAPAIVLPAMSSFPSHVSILFFFAVLCLSPDPSSNHSTPSHVCPGAYQCFTNDSLSRGYPGQFLRFRLVWNSMANTRDS